MKYKNFFWAIVLIAVGILFLLNNLGVISFSWYSFWHLWPVLLILWGIAILPVRDLIKYILLSVVVLFMFLSINRFPSEAPWYFHFNGPHDWSWRFGDKDEEREASPNIKEQSFTVPFDSTVHRSILHLDAAAGNFDIDSSSADLLSFMKSGDIGNYELTTDNMKGVRNITIRLREAHSGPSHKNQVNIRLNPVPSWNLDFDIGAADVNLDLARYHIDTASFDAGASSINVRLGDLNPMSIITFNAGASSVTLKVPKAVGCEVKSESFLISRDLPGFRKKGGVYQTDNYNSSKKKIRINLKSAVSSINIERY
ncbi:MAG: DUF5668 domain-containing protein [Bacteroidota bacterium]|nr:DUF5668 domain-containing protein [Bacteroidota bacterium]